MVMLFERSDGGPDELTITRCGQACFRVAQPRYGTADGWQTQHDPVADKAIHKYLLE